MHAKLWARVEEADTTESLVGRDAGFNLSAAHLKSRGGHYLEALLAVEEAAKVLGVSVGYVRFLCRDGRVPAVKIGRAWKVRPLDLEQYVSNLLLKEKEEDGGNGESGNKGN